jgi:CBS domain-containing protein
MIDIEESPDDEIRRYMTAQPVTVAPETPIGKMAQKMVDAHIHRVLVVVEQDRPLGIVTSTDILAAVAQAARRASRRGKAKLQRGEANPPVMRTRRGVAALSGGKHQNR